MRLSKGNNGAKVLVKSRKLAFKYLVSSSYEVNNKVKASNFIIKPSFILLEKNISSFLEEKLFQIAFAVSKKFDHIFLNTQKNHDNVTLIFNKNCVNIEDVAKAYFKQLKRELGLVFSDKVIVKLSSVQIQRGFIDRAVYFFDDKLILSTAGSFSSVHRHYNLSLSDEENKNLYQKCSVDHGHEYEVRVFLKKTLTKNSDNKFFDLSKLKTLLQQKVLKYFHGKYLNDIVGNTSGEVLVKHCYDQLKPFFSSLELAVELKETRKNSFFYPVNFYNCSNF